MMRYGIHVLAAMFVCFAACAAEQEGDAAAGVLPRVSQAEEPPAPTAFARAEALCATDALAALLRKADDSVVVLDGRGADEYAQGHIPGAFNVPSDQLQDPQRPPYFLAAAESVKSICAAAGINANSRVIICDGDDGRLAARIWFTLHAYGHNGAAILEGGVAKWQAENRAWTAETPHARPGTFVPAAQLRGVCAFADLAKFRVRVHSLGQMPASGLLDARSLNEYLGEDVRAKRGGHIPGAANIEWSAMLAGKEYARVWRSPPEIHAILRLAGIDRAQQIAVYDQAGGRSAHLYFTLWLMGFDHANNYTAGWREYGNRDDVECEK
jgi:thiosulfate/3-mercaptopyruvate sulfurtransferase